MAEKAAEAVAALSFSFPLVYKIRHHPLPPVLPLFTIEHNSPLFFIASRDEEEYVAEYPSYLISITDTIEKGEYGFGMCAFERTSMGARDKGKDWVGTGTGLWTITAAVYMALMGPNGFREIGQTILQKSHYAIKLLSEVK
ncbi:unnamed protein product, partial [marine sediment metagenome]